ncbi:hypothetical protein BP5796_04272 [Coleophoma crateriformis]|uniref:Uncharacterized protein n=1 Tax=Coleophoma crateriformis TaxID=565419 RepID=A0A3D8SHY0_9HELO|nr:hypothetical protein BP5796_04272 [Coleophoma crateriformis]
MQWFQFYTYNADALYILFWAVTLFCGTWRINTQPACLGDLSKYTGVVAKVFAIIFPAIILGVAQIKPIASHEVVFAVLCNACLVVSATVGAVLISLTLYRFVQSRRLLNGSTGATDYYTHSRSMTNGGGGGPDRNLTKRKQRAIDRVIIIRFTVAFILISIFEICDIVIQIRSFQSAGVDSGPQASDYSNSGAIGDIVTFLPGVTIPLVAWAIWGTKRTYLAETKALFAFLFCRCCCFSRRRRSVGSSIRRINSGDNTWELSGTITSGARRDSLGRLEADKNGASVMVSHGDHELSRSVGGQTIRIQTEVMVSR